MAQPCRLVPNSPTCPCWVAPCLPSISMIEPAMIPEVATSAPAATVQVAPYGSWRSPITSDLIVAKTIGVGGAQFDHADPHGTTVYWSEMRPAEGGRYAIVRRGPDGEITDVTAAPFNARSRVHEYGGGAFWAHAGRVYFSNFADGRVYVQELGGQPQPLTPAGGDWRYADFRGAGDRLIAVREDHTGTGEAVNTLVAIPLDGTAAEDATAIQVLAAGADFYASPSLSPDGTQLAWLTWDHPNLPWDGTTLWVAEVLPTGDLGRPVKVAGGPEESIFQPSWSPAGVLHFVSDRAEWWNLYRYVDGEVSSLYPTTAEFGLPQWVFGMSTYGFASRDHLICAATHDGVWSLGTLKLTTGQLATINLPYTSISNVQVTADRVLFNGGSPTEANALVQLDLRDFSIQILRQSLELDLDPGYLSEPESIEFPTSGNATAYGLFYRPKNRDYQAPPDEKPPLKVKIHGGPTAQTGSTLNLSIQYWTSRGFAVLDVNYGGSTGYGRQYRRRLDGQWGIVDVDDCEFGARYLVERGWVDGDRLTIAGGSAGGYTTLAALTFRDTFKAGASYYGIGDLTALARDTHKFESRYLDRLIGPFPARQDLYEARSPLNFTDRLSCPVIFFQGLEDKVVPPNQAESMVEALEAKGIPVAYVPFPGEQHGFRQADSIKRALDGEFSFYAQIFGFTPADPIEPVAIANLPTPS